MTGLPLSSEIHQPTGGTYRFVQGIGKRISLVRSSDAGPGALEGFPEMTSWLGVPRVLDSLDGWDEDFREAVDDLW